MDISHHKSERVLLRPYRDDDFERLLELSSDPDVMKYLTNGQPSSREEVEAGVARTLLYQEKFNGSLGLWTAELIQSGEFMGWFFLRPGKQDPENTRVLELGYRLKKKFWGKGYATEVSRDLVRKAFKDLDAECVFAQAHAQNRPSQRVMEKIGMRFEREFIDPSDPRQEPAVLYRLTRAVWEKSPAPTPR